MSFCRQSVFKNKCRHPQVALLRNVARTASITSLTPTMLITLSRDLFWQVVNKEPDVQRILLEARDRDN